MKLDYNIDFEINRLIFTLEQIKSEFYQRNDFFVLPYQTDIPHGIYLPPINYFEIENFKKKIPSKDVYEESSSENTKNFTKEDIEFLKESLKNDLLTAKELNYCEKILNDVKKPFMNILKSLFNIENFEIFIIPTHIGSIASAGEEENKLTITWRMGNDISQAIAMVIDAFVFRKFYKDQYGRQGWIDKEKFIDHLMMKTALRDLFPNYTPTINQNIGNEITDKVRRESQKYLKRLDFSINDEVYISKDQIYINGAKLNTTKNYPETISFLKSLINNKGEIVNFYDLGKEVWNENINKFSLQALAKQAQFAREVLIENGLTKNKIKTFRKKGYMLCR